MTAQIIYLVLAFYSLSLSAVKDKKLKPYNDLHYDFKISLLNHIIMLSLLYWGGFFDKLF